MIGLGISAVRHQRSFDVYVFRRSVRPCQKIENLCVMGDRAMRGHLGSDPELDLRP